MQSTIERIFNHEIKTNGQVSNGTITFTVRVHRYERLAIKTIVKVEIESEKITNVDTSRVLPSFIIQSIKSMVHEMIQERSGLLQVT